MYRRNGATPRSPIVVEYRSWRIRPRVLLLGAIIVAAALGFIAAFHVSHLTCSRNHDDESGTCRIRRYGIIGSVDEQLSASEIASFDVQIRTGSKGGRYAEVRLFMTPESHRTTIELEPSLWRNVDPATANEARSAFLAFRNGRSRSVDRWLFSGWSTALMLLLSGGLLALGGAMLREQLSQLRSIRLVVLPEREVVVVRGHEVPWTEIEDVKVALGGALFWSTGKNEYIPGYRLVLISRTGNDIPATREYRAGDRSDHDRARVELLRALGRSSD